MQIKDDCSLPSIVQIHKDIFGADFPMESFQKKIKLGHSLHKIGFYENETLVGYCIVIQYDEKSSLHAWVGGVLPSFQGRGFFSQFYDWLIQWARASGHHYVTGNTDNYKPNMLTLLIKKGFDIIGVEDTTYGDGNKILFRYKVCTPVSLRISIISPCNLQCFFCHHEGIALTGEKRLQISQIERLLIQAKKNGVNEITITGGEPALYPEGVNFILQYCSSWSNPPAIKITTNGLLWSEQQLRDMSQYKGKLDFHVSCHSLDAASMGKICGNSVSSDHYPWLFYYLKQYGIAYRINTTVLKGLNDSPEAMIQMIDFCFAHHIPKIHFMELLVTKAQKRLHQYYVSFSDIVSAALGVLSKTYNISLEFESEKKRTYTVSCGTESLLVTFYRLTCRTDCSHCLTDNDIRIGADGMIHPCYMEEMTCGNAVESLAGSLDALKKFLSCRDPAFGAECLYWGD